MMRIADQVECLAGGLEPDEAVRLSELNSHQTRTEFLNGELLAKWGWRVRESDHYIADVWCLSFAPSDDHKVYFARRSRELLDFLMIQFTSIHALVHVRHDNARKWLEWLGFKHSHTLVSGTTGEAFFDMERKRWGS